MSIEEMEALWEPIDKTDHWGPLDEKLAEIRRMGEAHTLQPAARRGLLH